MLKPIGQNAVHSLSFSKLQQRISISQFYYSPFLNHSSLTNTIANFPHIHTQIPLMVTASSASTKRPTCPSCSKPASVCLCSRLRTPAIHNSVAVAIFQHRLEKNHPLNSARIAKIGLKNVDFVSVSDVHSEARFFIRLLREDRIEFDATCHLSDEMPRREKNDEFLETADLDGLIVETNQLCQNFANSRGSELCDFSFTIARTGKISPISNYKMGLEDHLDDKGFDQLLASNAAVDVIRKGFVVKKFKMKEKREQCQEIEEFEIVVPAGSVLLFPSEGSVDVEAVDYEVKNLIVLDGTWSKAKRMYKENPWLMLLPHIRLNLDKLSLYSEVRTQPRAGYLSTIESIVYAMKAVGEDNAEGLDGLLDVFESMVGDQRRCKDERLSKLSENKALDRMAMNEL